MWPNTLVWIKQCNKIKPKLRQVRVSSAELVAYVSLPCESLATWLSILVLVLTLFTRETFKDISQHLVSLTILQLDSSIIDLLSDIVMIKLRTITLLLKLQANIHWCWHWFAASHPKSFQYSWCISRLTYPYAFNHFSVFRRWYKFPNFIGVQWFHFLFHCILPEVFFVTFHSICIWD